MHMHTHICETRTPSKQGCPLVCPPCPRDTHTHKHAHKHTHTDTKHTRTHLTGEAAPSSRPAPVTHIRTSMHTFTHADTKHTHTPDRQSCPLVCPPCPCDTQTHKHAHIYTHIHKTHTHTPDRRSCPSCARPVPSPTPATGCHLPPFPLWPPSPCSALAGDASRVQRGCVVDVVLILFVWG